MRVEWCVAACLAAGLSVGEVQAQSRPGDYGGGFIELLMTGARPAPATRATYAQPHSGDPILDHGVLPRDPAAYGSGRPRMLSSGDRVPEPRAEAMEAWPVRAPGPTRSASLSADPAREAAPERIARASDPRYARQVVEYDGSQRPGTIVVDTPSKFLYLVQPGGKAIRYGIGVGRPGFAWSGLKTISQKREWPDWTPPAEMMRRRPDLPSHMAGGPANPLGARALYLGSSLYRIHGTNEPHTIGQNVSSGCIRMMNEDVIDLYERTPVGTRVEVI